MQLSLPLRYPCLEPDSSWRQITAEEALEDILAPWGLRGRVLIIGNLTIAKRWPEDQSAPIRIRDNTFISGALNVYRANLRFVGRNVRVGGEAWFSHTGLRSIGEGLCAGKILNFHDCPDFEHAALPLSAGEGFHVSACPLLSFAAGSGKEG